MDMANEDGHIVGRVVMVKEGSKAHHALRLSIGKWVGIVKGEVEDDGIHNCALCCAFYNWSKCDGCPVRKETGYDGCRGTPYNGYQGSLYDGDKLLFARNELAFLKSLLPPGDPLKRSGLEVNAWHDLFVSRKRRQAL